MNLCESESRNDMLYLYISKEGLIFCLRAAVRRVDTDEVMFRTFIFSTYSQHLMTEPADYLRTAVCARAPVQQRYKNYAAVSRHTLVRDTVSTC